MTKAKMEETMKNDKKEDDLITYNINVRSYSFRDNVQMIDVFKNILDTLPLQMYLDDERSKRKNKPQQSSTGSIIN